MSAYWRRAAATVLAAALWLAPAAIAGAIPDFTPPAMPEIHIGDVPLPESILDFDSRIVVADDGGLTVTETIAVQAIGFEIKHGIYRDFPTVYDGPLFTRVEVPFALVTVLRDGQPEAHRIEAIDNGVRIYAGDADTLLAPGRYTYTITYTTGRQLGFFADHDELYWNVTGNGWAFPVLRATATVALPAAIPRQSVTLTGYTGAAGSTAQDLTSSVDADGNLVFRTTQALAAHEGLTIVASFPRGFIQPPSDGERREALLRANPVLIVGPIGLGAVMLYYLAAWVLIGRDPARGTIIPRFEPPLGLDPASLRYVGGMGYDERCFTAALVSLAVKGWARIEDDGSDYTLVAASAHTAALGAAERRVHQALLSGGQIELVQKNHTTIKAAIRALREALQREYDGSMFRANRRWVVPGLVLTALAILAAGLSGPINRSAAFVFMIVWLSGWTFACFHLATQVVRGWRDVVRPRSGIMGRVGAVVIALIATAFAAPFFAGEGFGLFMLMQSSSPWLAPVLVALVGLNFVFYYLLKQPTVAGRKVMDEIDGFKMYLTTAEGAELATAAPAKTPELYERLLPYAIALGVENAWADQFADVLRAAGQDGGGYRPGWYQGNSLSTLDSGRFASALSASLASSVASSSTAPGSRSGSSGGSSGGGGGGGGGGGW